MPTVEQGNQQGKSEALLQSTIYTAFAMNGNTVCHSTDQYTSFNISTWSPSAVSPLLT